MGEDELSLLEELKQWRTMTAMAEGREPYLVFPNATLEATVKARPQTLADFTAIKGWGEKKILRYGAAVLGILQGVKTIQEARQQRPLQVSREEGIFSVRECTYAMNVHLGLLGTVRVQGEVVLQKGMRMDRGYTFFTLKDTATAEHVIDCFIGWKAMDSFSYLIEDGLEVVITARPKLYEKNGRFSLDITSIEPVGEGALKKAFEHLKKTLGDRGWFDEKRKRPLPRVVSRIGVVTSAKGAAINDFKQNLGEYGFFAAICDAHVEGAHAEDDIIAGIRRCSAIVPAVDVIVVIRGGGSIESLQAFNTERVAEAIISCRVPVMTGIGHEHDQTIADLASDASFSTPTAVAHYLRAMREDIVMEVAESAHHISRYMEEILRSHRDRTTQGSMLVIARFDRILSHHRHRLRSMVADIYAASQRMSVRVSRAITRLHRAGARYHEYLHRCEERISAAWHGMSASLARIGDDGRKRLAVADSSLHALDPSAVLRRGYSIAYDGDGRVIASAGIVESGQALRLHFSDGNVATHVD